MGIDSVEKGQILVMLLTELEGVAGSLCTSLIRRVAFLTGVFCMGQSMNKSVSAACLVLKVLEQ